MKKRFLPIIAIFVLLLALMIGGCDDAQPPVERIALSSLPKLEYLKGEPFDIAGSRVVVYYADGRMETIPLTLEMLSDYNHQEVGSHILRVNYENTYATIRINISNSAVTHVEAVSGTLPYKSHYIEEQSFDAENLYLKINYETGDPDVIPVTADMVEGFNSTAVGNQTLRINYIEPTTQKKFVAEFSINIRARQVKNISIASPPQKKLYLVNEKITLESLAGGVLFVAYDNELTERIPFEQLFSTQQELDAALEYDTAHEKNREIVYLSFGGKEVIFDIKVLIKDALSFEIITLPTDIAPQVMGADLSLTGGRIKVYYNNETEEIFDMTHPKVISATGYNKEFVGTQTITLAFSDIASVFEFNILVIDAVPVELEVLAPVLENGVVKRFSEVTATGLDVIYYQDNLLSLDLWEYRFKLDNGRHTSIYPLLDSGIVVSGGAGALYLENAGEKKLSFSITYGGEIFNDEIILNVAAKLVTRLEVTPPENYIYFVGDPLMLAGAEYTAYFNDGSAQSGAITSSMVSGYVSGEAGQKIITVTFTTEKFGLKTATFSVLVVKRPERIEFDANRSTGLKTVYVLGETFDTTGLVMNLYYQGQSTVDSINGNFGAEWTFKNTHFTTLGTNYVVVEYKAYGAPAFTANIAVNVKNDLVSIALLAEQTENGETVYLEANSFPVTVAGTFIPLTGYFLQCTFENGDITLIPITSGMLNYSRMDKTIGLRSVTLSYQGKYTTNLSVEVIEREVTSFVLVSPPQKSYYKANEGATHVLDGVALRIGFSNDTYLNVQGTQLDFVKIESGKAVYSHKFYEDGQVNEIEIYFDVLDDTLALNIALRTDNITVSLGESGLAVNYSLIVTHKIATGITWDISDDGEEETLQPEIKAYQSLSASYIQYSPDAKFKVIYNDGELEEIVLLKDVWSEIQMTDFNPELQGTQTVSLRYLDLKFKAAISVQAKELTALRLASTFNIPAVTEGLELNLVNATLVATFIHNIDGEAVPFTFEQTVPVSRDMVKNYNTSIGATSTFELRIEYTFGGKLYTVYYNVPVLEKQLTHIDIYSMPKVKYMELDNFDITNGSIILYFNNNSHRFVNMSEAALVTDYTLAGDADFIINYGYFNNEDFSGLARRQEVYIRYKYSTALGEVTRETSYDITVHDRLYITVNFDEMEEFNASDSTYYFWYGEDVTLNYELWGYEFYTDVTANLQPRELTELKLGTNYIFKYVNVATGEEYDNWPKNAGTYTIHIIYNANSVLNNDRVHNVLNYSARKLVISPRSLRLSVLSLEKIYGEQTGQFDFVLEAIEFREGINGEILEYFRTENIFGYNETLSVLGGVTFICKDIYGNDIGLKTPVGQYAVSAVIGGNANYNVRIVNGGLAIKPRAVAVHAYSSGKIYGDQDPAFTYYTSGILGNAASGLLQGDSFTGSLLRIEPANNRAVGVYEITKGTLQNPNYTIVFHKNYFTISKRTVVISADSLSKTYGDTAPAYSVSYDSVGYDDRLIDLTQSGVYFKTVDSLGNEIIPASASAGSYTIVIIGTESKNYSVTFVNGTFNVAKRPVLVTPNAKELIYGYSPAEEVFTYTTGRVSGRGGLIGQETLVGSLNRADAGNVNAGTYAITSGTITSENNPNYDIVFESGQLFHIRQRAAQISIPAENLTREYNGKLPSISSDQYNLINAASDDIKSSISITFINPNINVGRYVANFVSTDTNHLLTFESSLNYIYIITQKQVSIDFFNVPYGELVNGMYSGTTYTGNPFYMEARVPASEVENNDIVNVSINIAEYVEGITPVFQQRTSVVSAGSYIVRANALSNSNYVLRPLTEQESEINIDYKETTFKITPLNLSVVILNNSKQYTGNEILFSNAMYYTDGYYQTADFRVLTTIHENPAAVQLEIYPYELVDGVSRRPRSVKYDPITDEILGYDIAVKVGNPNYRATLVKSDGAGGYVPVEFTEDGFLKHENDKFKVLQKIVDVIIDSTSVSKIYNGAAPSIEGASTNDSSVTASFNFVRIYENAASITGAASNAEYDVPAYMRDYIEDKDAGIFYIQPYSGDRNYNLVISAVSPKFYTIRRVRINQFRLNVTAKEYDGLKPALNVSDFAFTGYNGTSVDINRLKWEFDFGGESLFNVGVHSFHISFRFPHQDPDYRGLKYIFDVAANCEMLDYNHYFASAISMDRTFTINKRNVKVEMITSTELEGYNWKYYNGLEGATFVDNFLYGGTVPDFDGANSSRFERAFMVADSRELPELENLVKGEGGGTFANGVPYRLKHMLNGESTLTLTELIQGVLTLDSYMYVTPSTTSVRIENLLNHPLNNNFSITTESGSNKIGDFEIKRRVLEYYIDETQVVYGEKVQGKSDYQFRIKEDYIKYLGLSQFLDYYGITNMSQYTPGMAIQPNNLFGTTFNLNPLTPEVKEESGTVVGNLTQVGHYTIVSNNVIYVNNELRFAALNENAALSNILNILRRELPIRSMGTDGTGSRLLWRTYGDALGSVQFNYVAQAQANTYGVGLLPTDNTLTSSGFIPPEFTLAGLGEELYNNIGILPAGAISLAYTEGINRNYFFTYEEFKNESGNYLPVKLEIVRSELRVAVTNTAGERALTAEYGTLPEYTSDYNYSYNGYKLGDGVTNLLLPNSVSLPETTIMVNGESVTLVGGAIKDIALAHLDSITSVNLARKVNWSGSTVIPHTDLQAIFEIKDSYFIGTISRLGADGNYYDYEYNQTVYANDVNLTNYYVTLERTNYTVTQRKIDFWLESKYYGTEAEDAVFNMLQDETPVLWEDIKNEYMLYYYYAEQNGLLSGGIPNVDTSYDVARYVLLDAINGDVLTYENLVNTILRPQQTLNYLYNPKAQWLLANQIDTMEGIYLLAKLSIESILSYLDSPVFEEPLPYQNYKALNASQKVEAFVNYAGAGASAKDLVRNLSEAELQKVMDIHFGSLSYLLKKDSALSHYMVIDRGLETLINTDIPAYNNSISLNMTGSNDEQRYESLPESLKEDIAVYLFPELSARNFTAIWENYVLHYEADTVIAAALNGNESDVTKIMLYAYWSEWNESQPNAIYTALIAHAQSYIDTFKIPLYNADIHLTMLNYFTNQQLSKKIGLYNSLYPDTDRINNVTNAQWDDLMLMHYGGDTAQTTFAAEYPTFPYISDMYAEALISLYAVDSDYEYIFGMLDNTDYHKGMRSAIINNVSNFNFILNLHGILEYYEGSYEEIRDLILEHMISYSVRRRLYGYVFAEDRLVYGDTIGGDGAAINISNIALNYNSAAGEGKALSPLVYSLNQPFNGTGTNYLFNYLPSVANIYRYVVDIGYSGVLPNILTTESDFKIRVLYNDGYQEYISFLDVINKVKEDDSIDYERLFEYVTSPISLLNHLENQEVIVKLTEKFFKWDGEYEVVNEFTSTAFKVRVFEEGEDTLLWEQESRKDAVVDEYTYYNAFFRKSGETVYAKGAGDVFSENYTYYAGTLATRKEYTGINSLDAEPMLNTFDILETSFRLTPNKTANYYFNLIVNGKLNSSATELEKYFAIKFIGGISDYIQIVSHSGVVQNIPMPSSLDMFDGNAHKVRVFIDRLGANTASSMQYGNGCRLIVVIDDSYYYSHDLGTNAVENYSIAGFQANEVKAWIGYFETYKQGLHGAEGIIALPYTSHGTGGAISYHSHNYNLNGAGSMTLAYNTVEQWITGYVLERSSYYYSNNYVNGAVNKNNFQYRFYVGEEMFENDLLLGAGTYKILAEVYYEGSLFDTVEYDVNVASSYQRHNTLSSGTETSPYITRGRVYYGYTYPQGNDTTMNAASKRDVNISANSAVQSLAYSHVKTAFNLYFPSGIPNTSVGSNNEKESGNWDMPFHFAYIMKTTNNARDIRSYDNYASNDYSGIGLFVRYSAGTYYTKLYIREVGSDLEWKNEITSIDWSRAADERVVIDTYFDKHAGRINIYIIIGGTVVYDYHLYGNYGTLMSSTFATPKFILNSSKLTVYSVETGNKQISDYALFTDRYILPGRETQLASGTKALIAANNLVSELTGDVTDGLNMNALRSSFTKLELTFAANVSVTVPGGSDYLRLYISADGQISYSMSGGHHRGVYVGFRKSGEDFQIYMAVYKRGSNSLKIMAEQILYSVHESEAVNIIDGSFHTVALVIDRNTVNTAPISYMGDNVYQITNSFGQIVTLPTNNPYRLTGFLNPVMRGDGTYGVDPRYYYENNDFYYGGAVTNRLEINIDGELIGTAHIPYSNDLFHWPSGGVITNDDYYGEGFDKMFLPEYLYAGIDTLYSDLTIRRFVIS